MSGKCFFDTNILIYAVASADPRADKARALLADGGTVSVQVLNEFVAAAQRKYHMVWPDILEALTDFRVFCSELVPLTLQVHEPALEIAQRYGYRIYDCLVVASALASSCDTLYSEDMHDGQIIQSLTIHNPS